MGDCEGECLLGCDRIESLRNFRFYGNPSSTIFRVEEEDERFLRNLIHFYKTTRDHNPERSFI